VERRRQRQMCIRDSNISGQEITGHGFLHLVKE
jgi:hypothetical protein